MGGYKTQQVGDATEFSTTPETVPYPITMLAIPAVLLVLICFATGIIWGVVACGFVYGATYLLMHSKQATQYRQPSTFRVSPTLVAVGNTSVPRDAIHRVIIRNHVLKSAEGLIVVANPHANSGQSNTLAGMNWAISKLGPISYRVDVEARGVPTTLAGGLTEPVAAAILADVSKVLQLPAVVAT
jgi:hypothetical protein